METQEYVVQSLEQHLFFARIMKEHAFFLKVGFLPPDADFAKESGLIMRRFEQLLSRTIALSDCVVRQALLESGELFTKFTTCAEHQTQQLTGTFLDRRLTAREMRLQGSECCGDVCVSSGLTRQVQRLNRDGLQLVECLIDLKERVLRCVTSCNVFTSNYPLLIEHILREARLYRDHLMRLEGLDNCNCREIRDSEAFWNQIMMEHALFMRGLLDPSEDGLIHTANDFAMDYKGLLERDAAQCTDALELTRKFRDFKRAGVEGIEECKIRSIILPLLADHVLREANHYIRLLEE